MQCITSFIFVEKKETKNSVIFLQTVKVIAVCITVDVQNVHPSPTQALSSLRHATCYWHC